MKTYGCLQWEGVQTQLIRTHFDCIFYIFEDFLNKRENKNEQGNGGFIDATSEQLNFEHKIAPEIK